MPRERMNDDIRGGCRGQVPFSWDQIKNDSAREHYLGQCLVHEANWWSKAFTKEAVREELAAAAHRTQEIDEVRRREEQLMQEALGLAPKPGAPAAPPPPAASASEEQGGTWQEAAPRTVAPKEGDSTREHRHSHHRREHSKRRSSERSDDAHKHKHRHHHHGHRHERSRSRSRTRSRSRSPRHTKTKH